MGWLYAAFGCTCGSAFVWLAEGGFLYDYRCYDEFMTSLTRSLACFARVYVAHPLREEGFIFARTTWWATKCIRNFCAFVAQPLPREVHSSVDIS